MKTAFITGSSRGIGRAIALRLADEGYKVIIHGATLSEKLIELKNIIESKGGVAETVVCDLCDLKKTEVLATELDGVDILILNASIQYRIPWQEITVNDCFEQLNCNYISSLLLIQGVVPYMKENGWGRIITIGSVQEAKPHPDMLVYSSSKAAQTNMMHSLALQLAKDNITVNNVAPGVVYTDRNTEALSDVEYAKKVVESIPVGFYGMPEDCTGIVSFLCSEESRYVTGQSIYVDGGKGIQ